MRKRREIMRVSHRVKAWSDERVEHGEQREMPEIVMAALGRFIPLPACFHHALTSGTYVAATEPEFATSRCESSSVATGDDVTRGSLNSFTLRALQLSRSPSAYLVQLFATCAHSSDELLRPPLYGDVFSGRQKNHGGWTKIGASNIHSNCA